MQTLRIGSRGDDVRQAQTKLNLAGFVLSIDGVFGSQTENAVRAFQAKNNLVMDGIIGPNTWNKLNSLTTIPQPSVFQETIPTYTTKAVNNLAVGVTAGQDGLVSIKQPENKQKLGTFFKIAKDSWIYIALAGAIIAAYMYYDQKEKKTKIT